MIDITARKAEELNKAILLTENLGLYNLFYNIENVYQKNAALVKFNYQVVESQQKNEKNINVFFPINNEGFEDFFMSRYDFDLINDLKIANSLDWRVKQSSYDKFNEILDEFKLINTREERFSIYKKWSFGRIPDIDKVIEVWKNQALSEYSISQPFFNKFALSNAEYINLPLKNQCLSENTQQKLLQHYNENRIHLDKLKAVLYFCRLLDKMNQSDSSVPLTISFHCMNQYINSVPTSQLVISADPNFNGKEPYFDSHEESQNYYNRKYQCSHIFKINEKNEREHYLNFGKTRFDGKIEINKGDDLSVFNPLFKTLDIVEEIEIVNTQIQKNKLDEIVDFALTQRNHVSRI